jgi:hypothetical protein
MSKKLAIRGHATRGKEVIELFKMMGAKHFVLDGTHDWYVINDLDNSITFYDHNYINCHEFVKFTLEEFLDKYPFKVGDKVTDVYGKSLTIKSMGWLEDLETMVYAFEETSVVLSAKDLKPINDVGIKIENINMNIEFDLTKYSYEVKDGKLVIIEKKPKYPAT